MPGKTEFPGILFLESKYNDFRELVKFALSNLYNSVKLF